MKMVNKRTEAVVFFQVFIWWVIIPADWDSRLKKELAGFAPSFAFYRKMISRWICMSLAVTSRISMKKSFDFVFIVSFARFLTHRKKFQKIQLGHYMHHANTNSLKTPLWDVLQVRSSLILQTNPIYHWRLRGGKCWNLQRKYKSCNPVVVLSHGRYEPFYYLLLKLTRNNNLLFYDETLPFIFPAFINARGKKSLRWLSPLCLQSRCESVLQSFYCNDRKTHSKVFKFSVI